MYTALRQAYLGIDGARLRALRERYPAYRYFITEKSHALDFEPVVRTSAFVVYDLARPDGAAR
jgi:hypothetical protein